LDFRLQYQRKSSRCHLSKVSGCTTHRACCHVRTSLASKTRRMRSVLVNVGRFTCRLRMISCCLKRAFSAISSELLRPRSTTVCSGKEVTRGLVQRVKREESACRQPSKRRRREVTIPAILKTSPSHEQSVVQARGCCRRYLILHQPSCICKQGKQIFLLLEALVF
jgi:hypothetical protein